MKPIIAAIAATSALSAIALTFAVLGPPAAAQNSTILQPQSRVAVQPSVVLSPMRPHGFWRENATDEQAWRIATERNSVAAYEAYMRDYPQGAHFTEARDRRRALLGPTKVDRGVIIPPPVVQPPAPPPPPPPPRPMPEPQPRPRPLPDIVAPPVVINPGVVKTLPSKKSAEPPMETRSFEMKKSEAPADQAGPGTVDGPSPGDRGAAAPPPRPPGPGSGSAGTAPVRTEMTAVMTELLPTDQRRAQNGGAAMILLTNAPAQAARNMALCRALFTQLDTATTNEIDVGVRREGNVVQILRPVYWFMTANRQPPTAGPEACPARIANYHYRRADTIITRNLGLQGQGPWLAVVRTDDQAAGVIDLSNVTEQEITLWVRYFKDNYSKRDRVWSPEFNTPAAVNRDVLAYFGAQIASTLRAAPRAVFARR